MGTETILTIVFGLAFSAVIILWVEGIDYMNKNHPDYKGDDLFGLDDDEINDSLWDKNRRDYDED